MSYCNEKLMITAGDDFSLAVCFEYEDGVFDFAEGMRAVMIVHFGDESEEFEAAEYSGNTAKFNLSGEDTERLYERNKHGEFYICIRAVFPDGSRYTPIHRQLLFIEGC